MKFDLVGRIRNTSVPLHHAFLPLFEAVVNGIHATQERYGDLVTSKGEIDVTLHRLEQRSLAEPGRRPILPITALTVVDNGCGFTDAHLDAFETADTTAKATIGGKGVGRFSWLAVFESARISSTFETDSRRLERTFDFRVSASGIEDFAERVAAAEAKLETRIELRQIRQHFVEAFRKGVEVIAERVFEHCFNYFVLGRCPKIRLIDQNPDGTEIVQVNDHLSTVTYQDAVPLVVNEHRVSLQYVEQPWASGRQHTAHLCAHDREVTAFPLSQVTDLGNEPIRTPNGEALIEHVFVSGQALDESVDSTRTRLDLPDGHSLLEAAGRLDLKSLREAIGAHVSSKLEPIVAQERTENFARIQEHIRTKQPEYRHLISRAAQPLSKLRWTEDPSDLDSRLYKIQQALEAESRQKQAQIEKRLTRENEDQDRLAAEIFDLVTQVNEDGQANLVRYVTKRRAVLNLIQKLTSLSEGPALEERIHRIVFPMKKSADDIGYDDHNLWLVDDSLSFYEHVASDLTFSANSAAPVTSSRRPDILAFKAGDPFQHVAIVEFKRPDRDDENPAQQLFEYAVMLRDGGGRDATRRTLPGISKSVRIDAYAVVTLTPKLEKALRTGPANMVQVESEWRWYGGVPAENLSIEVLDYRAFVRRAEQRNRAFFVKLGLVG